VIVLADGRKLLTLRGRAENARMLVLCGATHSSLGAVDERRQGSLDSPDEDTGKGL
jgi:hypothetical protein